jgi:hypothetical protein
MDNNTPLKMMTTSIMSGCRMLGFDTDSHERQYKLTFNALTFVKPNPKAFELIVHFLLCQLDPERAQRTFHLCWPTVLKEQQKVFKDAVFAWLLEVEKSTKINPNKLPPSINNAPLHATTATQLVQQQYHSLFQQIKFPIVSKSLLAMPGGLKMCELLFALSQYVLLVKALKLSEFFYLFHSSRIENFTSFIKDVTI